MSNQTTPTPTPLPDGTQLDTSRTGNQVFIKPAVGRICVEVPHVSTQVAGSKLVLTQRAANQIAEANRATQGVVVANGDDADAEPWVDEATGKKWKPIYQPGDIVLFGKHSGIAITHGNKSYIILNEHEILATIVPLGDNVPRVQVKS